MFQLTIFHNEDDACETVADAIARMNKHGLKVVLNSYDDQWDEHTLVLQGTKAQFLEWNSECMEGGPSINVEEFEEALMEVVNLTAA